MSNTDDLEARIYPCKDCGKMRTKAEGGTTFTVCDECWDKHFKPFLVQPPSSEVISAGNAVNAAWESLPGPAHYPPHVIAEWMSGTMKPAIDQLRAALAHPKDPAPTVDSIIDVVAECVDMQDDDGSSCVVAVLDFDKLRTRLKTLFP